MEETVYHVEASELDAVRGRSEDDVCYKALIYAFEATGEDRDNVEHPVAGGVDGVPRHGFRVERWIERGVGWLLL